MGVEIPARSAKSRASSEKSYLYRVDLSRGSSGDAKSANCFEIGPGTFGGGKSCHGHGSQVGALCCRLWNRGMADVARLAMLIGGRVGMPVGGCVHSQRAHRKDEHHR